MNILFFIDSLRSGGKERQLAELVKGLTGRDDFRCLVVSMSHENHYLDDSHDIKIMERKCRKDPEVFHRFFALAKRFRPQVIHTWLSMASIYAIPSAFLLRAKLVDGSVRDATPQFSPIDGRFLLNRLTFALSHAVVGNSLAGLRAYGVPKSKGVCIYNGFDLRRIRDVKAVAVRAGLEIHSGPVVGMVATFSERKDYPTFFRSALSVLDKRPDVTFVVVGEGTDSDRCKEHVPDDLRRCFRFLGKRKNVESIVSIFDIGVLASHGSHGEGISNSIMEYMALSKPVVATDSGGTREIVVDGATGFLVPGADDRLLGEGILRLLQDKELSRNMGRTGRQRIQEEFSYDKMVDSFVNLYLRLCAK